MADAKKQAQSALGRSIRTSLAVSVELEKLSKDLRDAADPSLHPEDDHAERMYAVLLSASNTTNRLSKTLRSGK